jgi:ubiquinone biosynthesis protein UbiJ
MITTIVNKLSELLINIPPTLDSENFKPLQNHIGKTFAVEIINIKKLYFKINDGEFEYIDNAENIDATITGNTFNIAKMFFLKQNSVLKIEGDLNLIEALRDYIKELEVPVYDWLSYYTGDKVASFIEQGQIKTFDNLSKINETFKVSINKYLQEEKQLLISKYDLEDFYQELQQLRQAVDRLNARLNIVEEKLS